MRIGDNVPLPEPTTISDTSSDGENSAQSIPTRVSEDQLEAITESFPGDASAQSPQLLNDLAPDRLEPYIPGNLFEDQVKIDVFSNVPGNQNLEGEFNPANLMRNPANPTEKKGDRHYMGGTATGAPADALKNALGATGPDALKALLGGSKPSSGANVPHLLTGGGMVDRSGSGGGSSTVAKEGFGGGSSSGPTVHFGGRVGGRDMSLVGSTTWVAPNGWSFKTDKTEKGSKTEYYDPNGKKVGSSELTIEKDFATTKQYDENGVYQGKEVQKFDGSKPTKYDKDGKQIKYDTGEGGTAPVLAELEGTHKEFPGLFSVGGGYTDGRPELQSDVPMEKDPAKARNFGVIDVNPDYTEATAGADGTPGRTIGGNIAAPETVREELQAPKPEMPPTPGGNPTSDGSN